MGRQDQGDSCSSTPHCLNKRLGRNKSPISKAWKKTQVLFPSLSASLQQASRMKDKKQSSGVTPWAAILSVFISEVGLGWVSTGQSSSEKNPVLQQAVLPHSAARGHDTRHQPELLGVSHTLSFMLTFTFTALWSLSSQMSAFPRLS